MLLDAGPLVLHSAIAAIIWKPSIAAIAEPFLSAIAAMTAIAAIIWKPGLWNEWACWAAERENHLKFLDTLTFEGFVKQINRFQPRKTSGSASFLFLLASRSTCEKPFVVFKWKCDVLNVLDIAPLFNNKLYQKPGEIPLTCQEANIHYNGTADSRYR